jgi:purine-binding chemotaxis protein CheW
MIAQMQLCTFTVDDLLFGVDVTRVQEVLRYQEMTRVPLAPKVVRGLINLRGQIVMAIDLRERLGLPPRGDEQVPMNVVLRGADAPVSLLVDHIGDVIDVAVDTFDTPPSTVLECHRRVIEAVCKLPDHLLLVLDPELAVAADDDSAGRRGRAVS